MRIIPAIDLRGGRCVRLFRGDFARETTYSDDPPAVAGRFRAAGFDYLHVVDLDGARSGSQANRDIVARIVTDAGLDVQLGGGIRDRDAVAGWLDSGVARVVVGSVAITDPERVAGWMDEFGPDRLVLALDCRRDADGEPRLTSHGWTRDTAVTLWEGLERFSGADPKHVLCTDVGRDGALSGPAINLYREFAERYPRIALQASGGVRDVADLEALRELGIAAAITGRAMLDGRISDGEVQSFLRNA